MTERYYLTCDIEKNTGDIIAVISLGSPQVGDKHVIVCGIDRFKTQRDAEAWFDHQLATKPWLDTEASDYQTVSMPRGTARVRH